MPPLLLSVEIPVNQTDKYIFDLESEIQYLKKLLDDNGISYDYEAHLPRIRILRPFVPVVWKFLHRILCSNSAVPVLHPMMMAETMVSNIHLFMMR